MATDSALPPGSTVDVRVTSTDTVGAAALAIISILLLLALLRAHGRNRKLLDKLAKARQSET